MWAPREGNPQGGVKGKSTDVCYAGPGQSSLETGHQEGRELLGGTGPEVLPRLGGWGITENIDTRDTEQRGGNQAVISLGRSMHLNWKVLPPWLDTQFSRNQYLHDVNTKNRLDYSALEMNGEDM